MFLHFGSEFRSSVTGSVIKDVVCEKCGTSYQYELVRRGDGSGSAPYFIGDRSARAQAEARAQKLLHRRLRDGIDPVPCVDCGWVQSPMVAELRRRRLHWMIWCGGSIIGIGALTCGIWTLARPHGFASTMRAEDRQFLNAASLVTTIVAGTLFALRWVIQRSIDPNIAFPQHPMPVCGVPRGFKRGSPVIGLKETTTAGNGATAGLTYERTPPLVSRGSWVTVQLLHVRYPMACCSCIQPTEEIHLYSLSSRTEKMPVRICTRCRKRAALKVRGIVIIAALAGAALMSATLWYGMVNADDSKRTAELVGGIVLGALFLGLPAYYFIAQRF